MLVLRRFKSDDAVAYLQITGEENSYFPFAYCKKMEEAENVINAFVNSKKMNAYAITNDDLLIGAITYTCPETNVVEVSYYIGKDFRRKGYATQALKMFEKIIRENTKTTKIRFAIYCENTNSIKTVTKLGAICTQKGLLDYYEKELN